MKKWIARTILIIIISILLSNTNFIINDSVFNIMFTIIGIFFSISISQIMSFSFIGVENSEYVKRRKKNLNRIRKIFIWLFGITTFLFLLPDSFALMNKFFELINSKIKFDISFLQIKFIYLKLCLLLFVVIFYIYNFIKLSNLKSDIDEDIRNSHFEIDNK